MNVKLLTNILRLYLIVKLRNFIKVTNTTYENTENLRIVKLRNITKSYGRLHLCKIAYREITEYLRIVKLRNITKRYGVLRYVGLRRVWKLMKYYGA